jgi:phasin
MEIMTTETSFIFESVKQAFAPVTEALQGLQTAGVPESAREFVKQTVSSARQHATDAFAESEKATAVIETAVIGGVTEAAKLGRNIQQAIHQDTEAFFDGLGRLASATSFSEAVQIQGELARTRGEAMLSRAKSTSEYVGKLVVDGAKAMQDNFARASDASA